jgi:bile acid:Na+ symporter, BASS family
LATLLPAPGQTMRLWRWPLPLSAGAELTLPFMLLALLLFCAALQTEVTQIRSIAARPWALATGTIAVWLAPLVLVWVAAFVVPAVVDGQSSAGLMVGLALVASMPVANSSVGWTQLVRGNLALSLALVLLTIFLCPWITPGLLSLLRTFLASTDRASVETLIANFSGRFFIAWVILPTASGLICRWLIGPRRVADACSWITVASVAALLLLNYANAALALPEVFQQSQLSVVAVTAGLAAALSAVGLAAGWGIARMMRLEPESRSALMFGLGMKHTGLALILAGAVLAEERLAILIIVLATLAQHLLAGLVEWRMQEKEPEAGRPEPRTSQ